MIASAAAIVGVHPVIPREIAVIAEVVHSAVRYVEETGPQDRAGRYQQLVDAVSEWRDIAPESWARALAAA